MTKHSLLSTTKYGKSKWINIQHNSSFCKANRLKMLNIYKYSLFSIRVYYITSFQSAFYFYFCFLLIFVFAYIFMSLHPNVFSLPNLYLEKNSDLWKSCENSTISWIFVYLIHLDLTIVNILSYLHYLISFYIILVEPFESKMHASDILPLKTFTSHYLKAIASRLLQWTRYMYLYWLNYEFILLPLILTHFYRVLSLLPLIHNYIFLLPQWEPWFSRTSILIHLLNPKMHTCTIALELLHKYHYKKQTIFSKVQDFTIFLSLEYITLKAYRVLCSHIIWINSFLFSFV